MSDYRKNLIKLQISVLLCHIMLVYGILHPPSAALIVTGIILSVVYTIVGVDVGLHRYFAHNSFKTTPIKDFILTWSTVLTGNGSPLMYGAAHRVHHEKADHAGDLHNPNEIGWFRSWFLFWAPIEVKRKHLKGLFRTKSLKIVNTNYFLLFFLYMSVLFLIDPKVAIFLGALPAVVCFHAVTCVGVIPHYQGYRTYDTTDDANNSWVTSVISMGEGWHNNHHHRPGKYRHGEKKWELDPPAWIIEHFFLIKNES